jgi:hypothetical protein
LIEDLNPADRVRFRVRFLDPLVVTRELESAVSIRITVESDYYATNHTINGVFAAEEVRSAGYGAWKLKPARVWLYANSDGGLTGALNKITPSLAALDPAVGSTVDGFTVSFVVPEKFETVPVDPGQRLRIRGVSWETFYVLDQGAAPPPIEAVSVP